ncbi:UNVERIFIED_CONTAM: hypothetical protein K2H54_028061 [Gekko kuhli]
MSPGGGEWKGSPGRTDRSAVGRAVLLLLPLAGRLAATLLDGTACQRVLRQHRMQLRHLVGHRATMAVGPVTFILQFWTLSLLMVSISLKSLSFLLRCSLSEQS